jgi:hypothetical protein
MIIRGRSFKVYILAAAALLLGGCPTYETVETTIRLDTETSGSFSTKLTNIGSDDKDSGERESDLVFFIYDMLSSGFTFKEVTGYTGEVLEEDGMLSLRYSGRFDTALATAEAFEFHEMSLGLRGYELKFSKGAKVVETDGVPEYSSNQNRVLWPFGTKVFHYKLTSDPVAKTPIWKDEYSLMPEYVTHMKDPTVLRDRFIEKRLKRARESFEKGERLDAMDSFRRVLRIDPYNSEALVGLKELEEAEGK